VSAMSKEDEIALNKLVDAEKSELLVVLHNMRKAQELNLYNGQVELARLNRKVNAASGSDDRNLRRIRICEERMGEAKQYLESILKQIETTESITVPKETYGNE
jgi:hypothetical protein